MGLSPNKTPTLLLYIPLPLPPSAFHVLPPLLQIFPKHRKMVSMQSWVSEHKLTSIGTLWASAIGASLAYSRGKAPMKPSLRLIHARMHAQALTLGVLSGAAVWHYYGKQGGEQGDRTT